VKYSITTRALTIIFGILGMFEIVVMFAVQNVFNLEMN